MYLAHTVRECDFTGRKYAEPVQGAHIVAPGATGRWCWILCIGPELIAENGIVPLSREAVEALIALNHPGAEIDF